MKKLYYFLFPLLATFPYQMNAQPCSEELPRFGERQENPFGLPPNTESAVRLLFLLDVNDDGKEDAFVTDVLCIGPSCEGGVQSETQYYENTGDNEPDFVFQSGFYGAMAPFGWPDIPRVDIDGDSDLDIVRGFAFKPEPEGSSNISNVVHYENKASDNGQAGGFDFTDSEIQVNPWGIELPVSPVTGNRLGLINPCFGDLDDDGDLDFFTGGFWLSQQDERYVYFENTGNAYEPKFEEGPVFNPYGLELPLFFNHYSRLADIDCDGDLDLFTKFADAMGSLYFHENIGTPTEPDFSCTPILWPDNEFNPVFGVFRDIDRDGDLDVLSINADSPPAYYENITPDLNCMDRSPAAGFSYDGSELTYSFSDHSTGDFIAYFWDFGDGTASNEQNPEHTYAEEGAYDVCLSVSNGFKFDTYCETITIVAVGVLDGTDEVFVTLMPNPVIDFLTVQIKPKDQSGEILMELFSPIGQSVSHLRLSATGGVVEKRLALSDMRLISVVFR